MSAKKRILIIGETGSGKSSVIKLLTGNKEIPTSDQAIGCTFECKIYDHGEFLFIDTTGFGEGSKGTVPDAKAVGKLIKFLTANKDGFSLIVTVRQRGKITEIDENNYKLFHDTLCEEKIPNLLLITGCELDDPINQWWNCNKKFFIDNYKMKFVSGICICAADDDTIQKMNPSVQQIVKDVREMSKMELIKSLQKLPLQYPVPLYIDTWYKPFIRVCRVFLKAIGITADRIADWMKSGLELILIKKFRYSAIEAAEIAVEIAAEK